MHTPLKRTPEFTRNPELEEILDRLAGILSGAENDATRDFVRPGHPVVMLFGCARSGTTLLMQMLAGSECFTYPTNLVSRFYYAPYIGALIQKMMVDPRLSYRDEFKELEPLSIELESDLGKTRGILAPNEFYFFWRRFLQYGEIQYMNPEQLEKVDSDTLLSELAALESVTNRPLLMKAMLMNWNIEFLNALLNKAVFIHVKRDLLYCAQSLLHARLHFSGDENEWYSFKPPEYPYLSHMSPAEQVVGQVFYTDMAIEKAFKKIPLDKKLVIDYGDLCSSPRETLAGLEEKIQAQGYQLNLGQNIRDIEITSRDKRRVDNETWRIMKSAEEYFLSQTSSHTKTC